MRKLLTKKPDVVAAVVAELTPIESDDGYACPDCGGLFLDKEEAQDCCPRDVPSCRVYQCQECDALHETEDEARYCCVEEVVQ